MPGPDTAIPGTIALLEADNVIVVLELVAFAVTVNAEAGTIPTIRKGADVVIGVLTVPDAEIATPAKESPVVVEPVLPAAAPM